MKSLQEAFEMLIAYHSNHEDLQQDTLIKIEAEDHHSRYAKLLE
jgi:hypothetical protein